MNLLKSRREQLESLRNEIVGDWKLPNAESDRANASISVLAGTGQLIVSDAYIDVARLLGRDTLTIVPDSPLPLLAGTRVTPVQGPARQWHLTAIRKPARLNGAGVKIGVIDTGYDPSLPDLQAPFTATYAEWQPYQPAIGGQPAHDDYMMTGLPARDFNGHGSIVCAFLAGKKSGVAPKATILVAALPITGFGSTQGQFVVALNWLCSQGCDIITTSLATGGPGDVPQPSANPLVPPNGPSLEAAEYALAQTETASQTLITGAIGNTGAQGKYQHPGSSAHVTGIGAVNKSLQLFGSAWGPVVPPGFNKPQLVAPGYELQLPTSPATHNRVGGTSFATPIVAGAAALIIQSNPATFRGKPHVIRAKLATLVRSVSGAPANSTGAGLLDLFTL